ncbi:DUF418 domain-containing protein (plasmid) [Bacillus mycoides]|nr:DUF418 domain-containing protein [Bacillus mycoides]
MENNNNRIDIIDYLRGFALIGVLLVNVIGLLWIKMPSPKSIDESYQHFVYLFVEARFYIIFTFLFGVGFYIFITRAKEKGSNAYILFVRRLIILYPIGFIHSMFNSGEALTAYAVLGMLLLPFYKFKKQINLALGALGVICLSYLGSKELLIVPLFLLGLAAGQYCIFENISENIKKYKFFTMIAVVLSVIGLWFQYIHIPPKIFEFIVNVKRPEAIASNTFLQIGVIIGPIISASYIGILILLLQYTWVQKLLSPLKYYGRMALTNYISQTALVLIGGYFFRLTGNISYLQSFFVCLGIYVIQLLFSMIWLRFFRMGPLEWLWRICTYWKVVSIKN